MFSIWQMRRPKLTGACTAKKNIIRTCKTLKGIAYQTQSLFLSSNECRRRVADRYQKKIVHVDPTIQSTCTILNPLTNDHCLTSCAGSDELHWCLDIFLNEVNIFLCILWKIFKGLASGQITKVTIKLFIYWFAVL